MNAKANRKSPTASGVEPVFPGLRACTHMPFFDGETLLFCRSETPVERQVANGGNLWRRMPRNRRLRERFGDWPRFNTATYRQWKLYYCPWQQREPIRLDTGLPDEAIECSPAFYQDPNGKLTVSFIGGLWAGRGVVYRLYVMEGESLDQLSPARPALDEATRMGCAAPGYQCTAAGDGFVLIPRGGGPAKRFSCSLARLSRISFQADQPENLLLTGADAAGQNKTLVYNTQSGGVQEIRSSVTVYKCSPCGNQVVIAAKETAGAGVTGRTEPYALVVAPYTLAPSTETIHPAT